MQWKEWRRVKYKMSFYFPSSSTFFKFLESTGRRCASVLKIQCSRGSRSSSENIKYKYLERETWVCEAWGTRLFSETTKTQRKITSASPFPLWRSVDNSQVQQNLKKYTRYCWGKEAAVCFGPWTRTIQSSPKGLPWWLSSKESTCQHRRHGFNPWPGRSHTWNIWACAPQLLSLCSGAWELQL